MLLDYHKYCRRLPIGCPCQSRPMNDLFYNNQRERFTALWETCSPEDRAWIHDFTKKNQLHYDYVVAIKARSILAHMSKTKGGRAFREVNSNLTGIIRVLDEGISPEDITAMISNQWKLWQGDQVTRQWFRPCTLFGPKKFDNYLAQTPKRTRPVQPEARPEPIDDAQFNRNRTAAQNAVAALRGMMKPKIISTQKETP